MTFLHKLIEIGKLEFKTSFVYRVRFMSSIVISPLILLLYYFVWSSVYQNSATDTILGYNFQNMITYYVLSMIVGHFIFNMVGNKMQRKIINGELTQDLLKPIPVFFQFLSRELADRSFAFLVEVIPVFLISFFLFNLELTSITYVVLFLVALFFAFFINFLLGFMMGLLAFWILNIGAVQWLMSFFVRFMSGEFIPLEFFGNFVFVLSQYLPFYYVRYGVIQLFLGKFTLTNSFKFLGIQLIWIILLYAIIQIVWNRALKKFGAVGG